MKRFVLAAALAVFVSCASIAKAEEDKQFVNKEGEYVLVQFRDNKAFSAVVAVVENAGYELLLNVGNLVPASTKEDTWCKVNPWHEKDIIIECYTPHLGHAIEVRDHAHDYSQVLNVLKRVREEHRRASKLLGIK